MGQILSKSLCICQEHSNNKKWKCYEPTKAQMEGYIFDIEHSCESEDLIKELNFTPDPFETATVSEIDMTAEDAIDRFFFVDSLNG